MGATVTEIGWFFVVYTEEGDAFGSDVLPYRDWVSSSPLPPSGLYLCVTHSSLTCVSFLVLPMTWTSRSLERISCNDRITAW